TESLVGMEAQNFGSKVLVHYGGGSIKRSGLLDKVIKSLQQVRVEYIELGGVQPNPRLSLVREGIKLCREHKIDLILAVGGGSVIDSAKAISAGVFYSGDVWDFYERKVTAERALPVGVVLTIPAAGSEASKNSVVTNEDGWYKRGCASERLRPRFAIMNPELTFTLPAFQTASGTVDIIAHVIERYFTNTPHVDLTDRLCESVIKTVINNTLIVMSEPENYDARAEIMWASTLAHNDLLSTGRIGDWGSHAIEHELSGIYDVTHGAGLAVIIPAWMKYVYKHDVGRFAQFAQRVWEINYPGNPEQMALAGIERLIAFFKDIGLPGTLRDLNIPGDRLAEMADKATKSGTVTVGNFVKLGREDIINIYRMAL
ncbi:MAG: iron-containing alcohol dehydrogenase, partial [Desulfitobacteriaceae bacterium]|nr:iron-containing alcohol dehydrogenase [Desulfitobacteriaceae bacterium]